jgi:hypothetical protein
MYQTPRQPIAEASVPGHGKRAAHEQEAAREAKAL